jgi:hypothetical protein
MDMDGWPFFSRVYGGKPEEFPSTEDLLVPWGWRDDRFPRPGRNPCGSHGAKEMDDAALDVHRHNKTLDLAGKALAVIDPDRKDPADLSFRVLHGFPLLIDGAPGR